MTAITDPRILRKLSYAHSIVYLTLLYFAVIHRNDDIVFWLGWVHGVAWLAMSGLCLEAVRRFRIPLWLGVMVAVIGGIGPFAGSIGFYVENRRISGQDPAMLG